MTHHSDNPPDPAAALVERAKPFHCICEKVVNGFEVSPFCPIHNPAVADRATAPAPLEQLIEKWRGSAVVVDGNVTCVNHAYYHCADDLEAALRALPSRRETGEKS